MAKGKRVGRSVGSAGAGGRSANLNLLERVLGPIVQDLKGLGADAATMPREAVFERYVDSYLAMYAVGQIGEMMFERLTDGLADADKVAIAAACRGAVDAQVEKFGEILIKGDTGPSV